MFDLSKAGYCTPVVVSIVLSSLVLLVLLIQLIMNKDSKRSRKELSVALLMHALWAALIIGVMFYLCANGKVMASSILFGIFYLMPIAVFFIVMATRSYKRMSDPMY